MRAPVPTGTDPGPARSRGVPGGNVFAGGAQIRTMARADETVEPADVRHADAGAVGTAGDGSRVYHESNVSNLDSVHDDRTRRVLINPELAPTGSLLVDTVSYGPGVSCPLHYHRDTEHFFYVLDGEGVIEIEGEEFEIEAGSVVWVGDGDAHRLYAREDQAGMRLFEFFSNADRETVYPEGKACTWTPRSA